MRGKPIFFMLMSERVEPLFTLERLVLSVPLVAGGSKLSKQVVYKVQEHKCDAKYMDKYGSLPFPVWLK